MNDNPPAPNKASETELSRMIAEYGARLVGVCTLLLGNRDLAQVEQIPPAQIEKTERKNEEIILLKFPSDR